MKDEQVLTFISCQCSGRNEKGQLYGRKFDVRTSSLDEALSTGHEWHGQALELNSSHKRALLMKSSLMFH